MSAGRLEISETGYMVNFGSHSLPEINVRWSLDLTDRTDRHLNSFLVVPFAFCLFGSRGRGRDGFFTGPSKPKDAYTGVGDGGEVRDMEVEL